LQRQKTEHNYIVILKDSLKSKIGCLEDLIKLNNRIEKLALGEKWDYELFDELISEKGKLISRLDKLDDGFTGVYNRVKDVLNNEKDIYAEDIRELKDSIRIITELTLKLEKSELKNKEVFDNRLGSMSKEIKVARTSNKVAANYYQNMAKLNVIEPQFMDKKK